jgi:hypothetical protein
MAGTMMTKKLTENVQIADALLLMAMRKRDAIGVQ